MQFLLHFLLGFMVEVLGTAEGLELSLVLQRPVAVFVGQGQHAVPESVQPGQHSLLAQLQIIDREEIEADIDAHIVKFGQLLLHPPERLHHLIRKVVLLPTFLLMLLEAS